MTYSPAIYDWRPEVQPIDQLFRAGGVSVQGGMTLGGVSVENPEPGGRGELLFRFPMLALASANLSASWTLSRILNGAIMRIPLYSPCVQLIADAALGVTSGITWAGGYTWAGGIKWRFDPFALTTVAALKGAASVKVNMAALGRVADIGHLIGFGDVTHVIMDISYTAGNVATIAISPPLRKAQPVNSRCRFRPSMVATCTNAKDVADNFRNGRNMALNPARFVEAIL